MIRMRLEHVVFKLEVGDPSETGWRMFQKPAAREAKEKILETLSGLPRNTVLEIDFDALEYIDAVCANQVVVMVLRRLESGECPDRFILLSNIKYQHKRQMQYALMPAKKSVVITGEARRVGILGYLSGSYRAALLMLMHMGSGTARELQEAMRYKTVNEASTKLSSLYKQRLVAREPETGKRYRYISLLQAAGGKEEVST